VGERTRIGLGVLGAALVLGGLGDALLRATPWGVNFLLWVAVLVGIAVLLAKSGRVPLEGEGRWMVVVAVVFAAGVVLRDSPVVVLLDVLAVMLALSSGGVAGARREPAGRGHLAVRPGRDLRGGSRLGGDPSP
jgi:hypothetical protein